MALKQRNRLDGFQRRQLGGHSRLALERGHSSDAHAAWNADRFDHGTARLAEEADDHSVAAESQWAIDQLEE